MIKHRLIFDSNGIFVDGEHVFKNTINGDLKQDLSKLYSQMNIDYPKFHKMDTLCKLGFIGVEIIKSKVDFSPYEKDEIGLYFENSSSSLDSDLDHQKNIKEKTVSPAVFVYTLPNIVQGEIAIRNQWFGENLFVLSKSFDPDKWLKQAMGLIDCQRAEVILGGWVEVLKSKFEMQLFVVTKY